MSLGLWGAALRHFHYRYHRGAPVRMADAAVAELQQGPRQYADYRICRYAVTCRGFLAVRLGEYSALLVAWCKGPPGALRGRPPRSANAAATPPPLRRKPICQDRYSDTNPHATPPPPNHKKPATMPAGRKSKGCHRRGAPAQRWRRAETAQAAECVIYVTLKVGNH